MLSICEMTRGFPLHSVALFARRPWPDAIDVSALFFFFALMLCIPLFGYVLMYVDIRAYYRALKGVLVRVVFHFPDLPAWARYETPPYMRALGLSLPCTEADLKRAYRALAEKHHPDRGGDPQKFHRLREQFEASQQFLREHEPEFTADANKNSRER